MISDWKKEDPPPNQVKPIPVQVINCIAVFFQHSQNPDTKAIVDMIIIAYRYIDNNSNSNPFHLEDVQLFIDSRILDLMTAPDTELHQARFSALTFPD